MKRTGGLGLSGFDIVSSTDQFVFKDPSEDLSIFF